MLNLVTMHIIAMLQFLLTLKTLNPTVVMQKNMKLAEMVKRLLNYKERLKAN